ncbi:MAG: hypothetical protein Fues2KO_50570 [Fuerstiella sp.]
MKASETGRTGQSAHKETPENSSVFSGVRSRSQAINGPNWTCSEQQKRTESEDGGEMVAPVSRSAENLCRWPMVRAMIERCPDLPEKVRQQMIETGDREAAAND